MTGRRNFKDDFPILKTQMNGNPLVYLDNAATSQKPMPVIEAITAYYENQNANIHRGVYRLSAAATEAYEQTRLKVAAFINAPDDASVIITHGATESINIVAAGFAHTTLKKGDKVLISAMEHHANIVPWQMACETSGAKLAVIRLNTRGELDYDHFLELLDEQVKVLAITHISNSLGTINPVKEMVARAHFYGIPVLIDGAQSAAHLAVDVQDLGCEFFVFSGHKALGPTGTGFLCGKKDWLDKFPPHFGGGEMIKTVTFEKTTYNELPFKFEAGTPNIEGGICMGAAIDYLQDVGMTVVNEVETELLSSALMKLQEEPLVELIGTASDKTSIISFNIKGCHPYDVGVILDNMGVAVRTGHHCTQPVMDYYGVPGTVRASMSFYNSDEDIDRLLSGIKKAIKFLT